MRTDEQIIKMKRQLEQEAAQRKEAEHLEEETAHSIFDGTIPVFGQEVTFVRREFPEFGISMVMPEDFAPIEEDIKRLMYPSAERPNAVYTSEEEYMSISMKKNNNVIKEDQLKEFVEVSRKMMEIAGPRVKIVKTGVLAEGEFPLGTMEFISNAVDGVAYNYLGMAPLKTGVLLIGVLYKNSNKKRLCPIAREMIQSVLPLEEEAVE